ncbi:choice-of-anchor A family protein [Ruania halotolerans]|uniref:choice-of-anchor A family protein n=1 Tax=Ruania halotolerans TaxID=2897773 RepID=UPI001E3A6733|nr:choice-of-anchor A family protein [Ruania halotolerans]UFU06496.1 choice-of-anchor A family protein [Ruania halotolerans]
MTDPAQDRPGSGLLRRAATLVVGTALAMTGATVTSIATAGPASADVPADECPAEGEMPGIGNEPTFTDNNVAVYAGGNYVATGAAAESEGLLLVRGDATFDKDSGGVFNVGAVGVGSGITPSPGSTMLAVGGDLVIGDTTRVDVGANIDGGGAVRVGGAITVGDGLTSNGATIDEGLGATAAMDPYADFQDAITDASADIAAQTVIGTAERAGNSVTFTGSGDSTPQYFEISAADLSGATEVYIENVPDGAAVAITVTGGPVEFSPTYFSLDGERVDDFASPEFGNAASQLMWNFADAESVTIGGSSQFMGSILAPAADAEITASTNGRVYVGGDLTTSGTGNEQHNYPWIGAPELDCGTEPTAFGGFSVVKDVVGAAADLVPADAQFSVEYAYEVDGESVSGVVTVPADGTVVAGPQDVPAGTVVTFVESGVPEVDGVVWGDPVFSPSSVTVADGENVVVTLTNTADEVATPQTGGFSVVKDVVGAAAGLVPADAEFSVEYAYEVDGESVSGVVTVPADGTVVAGPQDVPAGTVVTFVESGVPEVDGVVWGDPVFSPSSVTVADGENVVVTLTNTADPAEAADGGSDGDEHESESDDGSTGDESTEGTLPETGSEALTSAAAAAGLLAIGMWLVLASRRRAQAQYTQA